MVGPVLTQQDAHSRAIGVGLPTIALPRSSLLLVWYKGVGNDKDYMYLRETTPGLSLIYRVDQDFKAQSATCVTSLKYALQIFVSRSIEPTLILASAY